MYCTSSSSVHVVVVVTAVIVAGFNSSSRSCSSSGSTKLSLVTLSPPLNSGILGLRMGPYVPSPKFFTISGDPGSDLSGFGASLA